MKNLVAATVKVVPLIALLLTTALQAPADAARAMGLVPGNEAAQRATKLTSEIHWYKDLSQAESEARRSGKMIFWMHMLGQMDGAT